MMRESNEMMEPYYRLRDYLIHYKLEDIHIITKWLFLEPDAYRPIFFVLKERARVSTDKKVLAIQ